jgi:hypothetical protein
MLVVRVLLEYIPVVEHLPVVLMVVVLDLTETRVRVGKVVEVVVGQK